MNSEVVHWQDTENSAPKLGTSSLILAAGVNWLPIVLSRFHCISRVYFCESIFGLCGLCNKSSILAVTTCQVQWRKSD